MSVPKNRQAELAAIGSVLAEGSSLAVIQKYLTPAMFYHPETRILIEAILEVGGKGVVIDSVTVAEELRRTQKHESVALISQCLDSVVNASHCEHYAKIVAACHYEREIIGQASALAVSAYQGDNSQAVLNKIRDLVMAKESLTAAMTFDYSKDLVSFYGSLGDKKSAATNKTGIAGIDAAWHGTRGGEINVWGAATNTGKSIMLLNLMHLAALQGKRCLYVGTEMSAFETAQRHLAVVSGVSAGKIRSSDIDIELMGKLKDTISDRMSTLPIHIYDSPEPNIEQIESVVASSKAQIVYLDYLERFSLPREESMRLRVKEFMRRVKSLARRHNVEIHLAAQLNRTTYGTEEKRPSLADLSESSAVEKEADRVILLWRPKTRQPADGYHALIEAIQAKNRHGYVGMAIDLYLNNSNLRIENKDTN
jgi:replicative DNA helicase